jgi:teichoic acid transport system ATP-binding protein
MQEKETVVKITNLVKEYKMFEHKKDRLIDAMFPWTHKYTTFKAMDNLNLDIKKGEVLGILGKNGAGKSTLLKMVTGVVTPTSGTIEAKGKISSLLELGAAFNSDLTGYENIYQHGTVMGLTQEEIKAKEQEIIEFADIGDHLYQPVKTYSSGMFARLAFACAINVNPDILIVDEVLSVGDMAFQLKCFKKFEQFKDSGKTILFVTHSTGAVLKNCTRSIIIDKGRKIFDGSVKEGVDKYKKLIVGIDPEEDDKQKEKAKKDFDKAIEKSHKSKKENLTVLTNKDDWKDYFIQNDNVQSYGNDQAEVIDYGIFDDEGHPLGTFDNKDIVTLKSKIKFNEDVNDPIFTMTIKDFQGNDITGNNTEFEKKQTGKFKKGDVAVCEFRQNIPVGAGRYTLSFSCTHYDKNGNLEVLNRKYDAILVEVISSKSYVGMFKIDSDITISKL